MAIAAGARSEMLTCCHVLYTHGGSRLLQDLVYESMKEFRSGIRTIGHGLYVELSGVAVDGPPRDGRGPRVPTDEELMEAFYAGDDDALECLIGRYGWLTRSALGRLPVRLGDRAAKAEEIVQIAWAKVADTRTTGRTRWLSERGLVRPWLWVVLSNCVHDEMRRSGVPSLSLDEFLQAPDRRQAEVFQQCELHVIVAACLESLEWRQQAVVNLKFWVGMVQSEIAVVLGLCEATVSRALDAALQALRPMLLAALRDDDEGRAE